MNTAAAPHHPDRPATPGRDDETLWRSFKQEGSAGAREELFSAHIGFARSLARRHWLNRHSGGIELAELHQLAFAGLLEALDSFDLDRGVPFKAYAARRISGSVIDGLAKMSEVREQISFRNRVRTERARSLAPSDTDNMSMDDAMRALADLAAGLAIGLMLDDGAYVPEDDKAPAPNAYESLAWKETIGRLLVELGRLPERERLIIRHHYMNGVTFDQLGAMLGVTKGRVSQIHRAAITLLRQRLKNAGEFKLER